MTILDLDNVFGGEKPSPEQLSRLEQHLAALREEGHHVVIAATHHLIATVGWIAPWARWRWRSGPHGPASAIVEMLSDEDIAGRFEQVIVHSGCGLLAEPVAALAAQGTLTTVVSLPHKLSKRLRFAAHHVSFEALVMEEYHDAA